MVERGESPIRRPTWRSVRQSRVMAVWSCVMLAATTAIAQQSVGTVTEPVTTGRDLNGREAVSEKVVTHRARANDEERTVVHLRHEVAQRDADRPRQPHRPAVSCDGGKSQK